jgi:hypothetical protein
VVSSFTELRLELSGNWGDGFPADGFPADGFPADGFHADGPAWNRLAGEMRANIAVGLAAGECVREAPVRKTFAGAFNGKAFWKAGSLKPVWAAGAAGILLVAGATVFLRGLLPREAAPDAARAAVVQSTGLGVEVRTGTGSMTLLNHGGDAGSQTVTSDGAIRASYVDGNTGTVTVTSVYVE